MTMANETSPAALLYYYYYHYLVLILYKMEVETSHKSQDIRGPRVKV